MSTIGGLNNFGLIKNGDFRLGNLTNFNFGVYNNIYQYNGIGCMVITGGAGAGVFSNEYIKVDTSKYYQLICFAKTIQRGTDGNLAGGHLGFACYDKNKLFVDLLNCGGVGNTYLSRQASAGDSIIYIQSNTDWYVGDISVWRYINLFPSSHPEWNEPFKYTRFTGYQTGYQYIQNGISLTNEGDYAVQLVGTLPNIGYSLPIGTPISNARAGGTYNYALGNPNYPETWTRYSTAPFTGESRNSGTPFRYGTKFIRFMVLLNYNQRTSNPQDHIWALDNIFFGEVIDGKDYRNIIK